MLFPFRMSAFGLLRTWLRFPCLLNRDSSKTQKPGKAPAKIVIKSLAHHVGKDLPDYTLCPVRALKAYKDRTKSDEVRKGRTRLFLPFRDTTDDISTSHISRWIVD